MKKLVITIQFVALMAMFPVYLVVELSQEKIHPPVKNNSSVIEATTEKDNIQTTSVDVDGQFSFLMFR
jgi:uncharacterized protein YxeA